jgi:hypothetical protein
MWAGAKSAEPTHIDHIVRPPGWVYGEIEEAIEHAIAGRLEARIRSREGCDYSVAELVECWELDEELLDCPPSGL